MSTELLPKEKQILDMAADELVAYRSVIARPGTAEVVVRIKIDRETEQPYSVETSVARRPHYLVSRATPPKCTGTGFVVDRRPRRQKI